MEANELTEKYPWLRRVRSEADDICDKLFDKEVHYAGSWQRRGGVGAAMMMLRKADRIEAIIAKDGYDIFNSLQHDRGEVRDDIRDLVGYLLLILSHDEAQP